MYGVSYPEIACGVRAVEAVLNSDGMRCSFTRPGFLHKKALNHHYENLSMLSLIMVTCEFQEEWGYLFFKNHTGRTAFISVTFGCLKVVSLVCLDSLCV